MSLADEAHDPGTALVVFLIMRHTPFIDERLSWYRTLQDIRSLPETRFRIPPEEV